MWTMLVNSLLFFNSRVLCFKAILTEIALQQDQIIQATDVISLCQKKLIFNGTFQEV